VVRVLSSVVLIAILGGIILYAPWWAAVALTAVIAALGAAEVAGLSAAIGAPVSKPVVMTAAVVVCVATALTSDLITGGPLVPVLLGAGVVTLGSGAPSPAVVTRAAMLVMAPLYVGVPLGALAWVYIIYGPMTLVFVLLLIAVSDSTQYFTGRAFGSRKLAPTVSPAKTIEGALGGVIAAAVVGALLAPMWIYGTTWLEGLVLGVVLCAAGIAGDLFESLLKRSAGVKDSSTLIPGHGGVLDRIDAHLFAGPVFVLFLRYVA